ncbi:hypothetical protein ACQP00_21635 [Dactylosporangium sp. CS-047395]|uniref:hypothetical protein n=1 Tax=Dactylosporangium sp. CS-047395 TaxID=3239936 RepID=UPI003D94FACB
MAAHLVAAGRDLVEALGQRWMTVQMPPDGGKQVRDHGCVRVGESAMQPVEGPGGGGGCVAQGGDLPCEAA